MSLRIVLEDRDRWPVLAPAAAMGLAAGVLMARIGLPPVDLHGPLHRWWGVMDPLCGGTRAVRLAAMGDFTAAWSYNPLGPILVTGALLALVRWSAATVSRRWLAVEVTLPRPLSTAVRIVMVLLVVLLEVRQQLNAQLLL